MGKQKHPLMQHKFIRWDNPPDRKSVFKQANQRNSGWDRLVEKLATNPGQWALIRISNKRHMYGKHYKQKYGLEIVTRQFIHNRTKKYGTWARIPAISPSVPSEEGTVKESFIDLTQTL